MTKPYKHLIFPGKTCKDSIYLNLIPFPTSGVAFSKVTCSHPVLVEYSRSIARSAGSVHCGGAGLPAKMIAMKPNFEQTKKKKKRFSNYCKRDIICDVLIIVFFTLFFFLQIECLAKFKNPRTFAFITYRYIWK